MYNPPRSNFYRRIDSPCHVCKKRQIGCHSDCPDYEKFKDTLAGEKNTVRGLNDVDHKISEIERMRSKKQREKYKGGR